MSVSLVSKFSIKNRMSGETPELALGRITLVSEDVSMSGKRAAPELTGSGPKFPKEVCLDSRNSGRLHLWGNLSSQGSSSNVNKSLSVLVETAWVLRSPDGVAFPEGSTCCSVLLGCTPVNSRLKLEVAESWSWLSDEDPGASAAVIRTSGTWGILVGEALTLDCGVRLCKVLVRLVSLMVDSSPMLECSLGLPSREWDGFRVGEARWGFLEGTSSRSRAGLGGRNMELSLACLPKVLLLGLLGCSWVLRKRLTLLIMERRWPCFS